MGHFLTPGCPVCRVYVGFTFDNIMYSATRCPNFMKYPFFDQFLDITKSRTICYFSKLPILLIRDAAILLCKKNRFLLPIIEFKHVDDSFRQPVPPQCHNKMGHALLKVGLREPRFPAIVNHVRCAGAGFLHVFNSKQGLGDQGVSWYRPMGFSQQVRGSKKGGDKHPACHVVDRCP